jgi:hypothetical protein
MLKQCMKLSCVSLFNHTKLSLGTIIAKNTFTVLVSRCSNYYWFPLISFLYCSPTNCKILLNGCGASGFDVLRGNFPQISFQIWSSPTKPHGRVSMFASAHHLQQQAWMPANQIGNYLCMCMSRYNATCFSFCKEQFLIFTPKRRW